MTCLSPTSGSGLQPCCTPCNFPFAQVTMTCSPSICLPTKPDPLKPLQLPCLQPNRVEMLSLKDAERFRNDNFYNNYNKDHHKKSIQKPCPIECQPCKQSRSCEDYTKTQSDYHLPAPGCPTGFKPCSLKLTSPANCNPCGTWQAQIQPCPPKPKKKKSNRYEPGQCTRPCCKHWKPKEGPCLYDDPCRAHCFNHLPGIKPSGRFS